MLKLVLLLLFVSGSLGQDECPKHCKCSSTADMELMAKCRILDPKAQRFPSDVNHLVVTNTPEGYTPQLTKEIFKELGLEKLKHIKIHNTTLQDISRDAFSGLDVLLSVDLSGNNIFSIHRDTFINNKHLDKLRLSRNPIQSIIFSNTYFLDIFSLKELDLSFCQLKKIPGSAFGELESLESINLSHNNIESLDEFIFAKLDMLIEVNLAYNELRNINNAIFFDLELKTLNLRGNKISTGKPLEFEDLEELDLSENMIKDLSQCKLFYNNPSLTNLNLGGNQIRAINDKDVFSSLESLKYLYLGSNDIFELPKGLFGKNEALELLTLSNNPLTYFNRTKTDSPGLRRLEIFNCGLVDLADSLTGLKHLDYLNVSHNNLKTLRTSDFSGLENLRYLDLSWNEIDYLPLDIFRDSPKMSRVVLSNNKLRHLSPIIFQHTPLVFYLDVSYNHFPYIWNTTEVIAVTKQGLLANLVMLNLAYNELKHIDVPTLSALPKLGTLDVSGNPLVCDDTFDYTLNYLERNKVNSGAREIPGMPVALGGEEDHPYQLWSHLRRAVCLEDDSVETIDESDQEDESDDEDDEDLDDERPRLFLGPIIAEREVFDWPTIGVAVMGIVVIIGLINWGIYMICRSRRNNRMVPYKSHFPNPLGGLSQIRHGSSSHIYHKLYEDCSVPNTPIVKGPGKNVIATIVHSVRPENV